MRITSVHFPLARQIADNHLFRQLHFRFGRLIIFCFGRKFWKGFIIIIIFLNCGLKF